MPSKLFVVNGALLETGLSPGCPSPAISRGGASLCPPLLITGPISQNPFCGSDDQLVMRWGIWKSRNGIIFNYYNKQPFLKKNYSKCLVKSSYNTKRRTPFPFSLYSCMRLWRFLPHCTTSVRIQTCLLHRQAHIIEFIHK